MNLNFKYLIESLDYLNEENETFEEGIEDPAHCSLRTVTTVIMSQKIGKKKLEWWIQAMSTTVDYL